MSNEEQARGTPAPEIPLQYPTERVTILRLNKNGRAFPLPSTFLPHPSSRAPPMMQTSTAAESTFEKLRTELGDNSRLLSALPIKDVKWVKQNEVTNALSYRIDLGKVRSASGNVSRLAAYYVPNGPDKTPDISLQYVDGLESDASKFVSKKRIHELSWVEGPVGVMSGWQNNSMNAVIKVYFLTSKEVSHEIHHEFPITATWKRGIIQVCRIFQERQKEVAKDRSTTNQSNKPSPYAQSHGSEVVGDTGASGSDPSQEQGRRPFGVADRLSSRIEHTVRSPTIEQLRNPIHPAIRRVFDVSSNENSSASSRRQDSSLPARLAAPPSLGPRTPFLPSLRHYDNAVLDQDLFGIVDPIIGDVRTARGHTSSTLNVSSKVAPPGNGVDHPASDRHRGEHITHSLERVSASANVDDESALKQPASPALPRRPSMLSRPRYGNSADTSASENFKHVQKEIAKTFEDEKVLSDAISKDRTRLNSLAGRDRELNAQKEAFLTRYNVDKKAIDSERVMVKKRIAQNEEMIYKAPEKRSRLCSSLSYDEVIKVGVEMGKGFGDVDKDRD